MDSRRNRGGENGRTKQVEAARSCRIARVAACFKKTTDEFHVLQVTQRPTFLIENAIGDCAVLSGVARVEPLAAAIDSLVADQAVHDSWKVHFGGPPLK